MSDHVRAELVIVGRVQGVFYRASAQQEGQRLGLVGEIRNEPDGSVFAVVEGPRETIEEFATWCRRGPPAARVDDVRIRWAGAAGAFHALRVTR